MADKKQENTVLTGFTSGFNPVGFIIEDIGIIYWVSDIDFGESILYGTCEHSGTEGYS